MNALKNSIQLQGIIHGEILFHEKLGSTPAASFELLITDNFKDGTKQDFLMSVIARNRMDSMVVQYCRDDIRPGDVVNVVGYIKKNSWLENGHQVYILPKYIQKTRGLR